MPEGCWEEGVVILCGVSDSLRTDFLRPSDRFAAKQGTLWLQTKYHKRVNRGDINYLIWSCVDDRCKGAERRLLSIEVIFV